MPDTPETLRARVIRALSEAGAWCGQCDEPDVGCLDCAVVLAKYADVAIAALAATAGPLSAEEYGHLRDLVQTKKLGTRGAEKLLTAYDALAAQVAKLQSQVRVEQALRRGAESAHRECAEALRATLDSQAQSHQRRLELAEQVRTLEAERDQWMARFDNEVHIGNKHYDDLAALRATVAKLQRYARCHWECSSNRPTSPEDTEPPMCDCGYETIVRDLAAHPTPTRIVTAIAKHIHR